MWTNNRKTTNGLALITALAAAASPLSSSHAAWEFYPDVEMQVQAGDNTRVRARQPEDRSSRTVLDARGRLTNFGERGDLFIEPRLRTDAYADSKDEELERDEYFFRAGGGYDWEVVGVRFFTDYSEQGLLSAELTDALPDDPDLADPLDPDTGQLDNFSVDRERFTASADATIQFSERNSFLFQLRTVDVAYSDPSLTSRSDFDYASFGAGIVRQVDERNQVSAIIYSSNYSAVKNDNETDTVGVEGRFGRPISTNWTFNLAFGVQRSDFRYLDVNGGVVDNADATLSFETGFRKRTELSVINLDIRRAEFPNANGFIVVRDELRGFWRRRLSPRLTLVMGGRYSTDNTLDDANTLNDREYLRGEFGVEWAFRERWTVIGGYDITIQEFPNDATTDQATRNVVYAGVAYRGLTRR